MIQVMIVDDSAVVRSLLAEQLEHEPDIHIVATATDPLFAQQKLRTVKPDVLILDIEMPRMDGLTFLRQIMGESPIPTIVFSSLASAGSCMALDAMDAGAVAILCKPGSGVSSYLLEQRELMVQTVRQAAKVRLKPPRPTALTTASVVPSAPRRVSTSLARTTDRVIAIGTSTGGTQALEYLLKRMPLDCAGMVIVQHMPANFTRLFAERLNNSCAIEVREAVHGDRVLPGQALIAPGGLHLSLIRSGAQYRVSVQSGPPVSRHCPSVDVLFRSVAKAAGRNALGVIMTGMGDDGARGLKVMQEAGALTLAQDEQSCVVYGMPKEAVKLGAVTRSHSLEQLPEQLCLYSKQA